MVDEPSLTLLSPTTSLVPMGYFCAQSLWLDGNLLNDICCNHCMWQGTLEGAQGGAGSQGGAGWPGAPERPGSRVGSEGGKWAAVCRAAGMRGQGVLSAQGQLCVTLLVFIVGVAGCWRWDQSFWLLG